MLVFLLVEKYSLKINKIKNKVVLDFIQVLLKNKNELSIELNGHKRQIGSAVFC